jgi:hypothetical protein
VLCTVDENRIIFPRGTAFGIQTASADMVLTALHVVDDIEASWIITPKLFRNANGLYYVETFKTVKIIHRGDVDSDDIAILTIAPSKFETEEMVKVCPADEIPELCTTNDVFLTYYCPIDDLTMDSGSPPIAASGSDWKTTYAISKSLNGKMWMRGGLCGGSSGGLVINARWQAVAMHCESTNPVRSLKDITEDRKTCLKAQKKKWSTKDTASTHSDALTELATLHSYSQVCPLLRFSSVLTTNLELL